MTDIRCRSCSTPISSFSDSKYCPACQQVQIQKEMAEQQKKNFEQQQSLSREAKQDLFNLKPTDSKTSSGSNGVSFIKLLFIFFFFPLWIFYWGFKNFPKQTTWILIAIVVIGAIKDGLSYTATLDWWQISLIVALTVASIMFIIYYAPQIKEGYAKGREAVNSNQRKGS